MNTAGAAGTFSDPNVGTGKPVSVSGITVTDGMCTTAMSGPSGDTNGDSKLQLTETWVYTCSHTVTQAEMDAGGNLSNTVTADSTESEPDTDTLLQSFSAADRVPLPAAGSYSSIRTLRLPAVAAGVG